VNASTILLTDGENIPVGRSFAFDPGNLTVRLQTFSLEGVFTVTIKGGVDTPHIIDATGTPLAADFTFTFTSVIGMP
jgi:hypothetical protein